MKTAIPVIADRDHAAASRTGPVNDVELPRGRNRYPQDIIKASCRPPGPGEIRRWRRRNMNLHEKTQSFSPIVGSARKGALRCFPELFVLYIAQRGGCFLFLAF